MKTKYVTILLMLLAAVLATVKLATDRDKQPQPGKVVAASCPNPGKGCRIEVDGRPVELKFDPAPLLLKPFTFTVKAGGVHAVFADFAMVDMDMGPNRYQLQPAGNGAWQAQVTLPACVAGRSDWLLTLEMDGQKVRVPFSIER